ncbi:uncharacterized protein LOC135116751 [Helicoverpa armigera]|uniref:uncharacterized protein LOC135116751 n=1 Tax=Helicoverpa armigera TaxID=29058 RepID=UPI003083B586
MLVLKGLLFMCIVIASAHCNNTEPTTTIGFKEENGNNTKMGVVALSSAASDTNSTIPTNVSSVTMPQESKIINIKTLPANVTQIRRTTVTINSPTALRQRKRKRRGKKSSDPTLAEVESLLYEEYDANGDKLVEFMMYTMEDVSKFFAGFLHTEICHVRCAPTPAQIKKEEEEKKAAEAAARAKS